MTDGVDYSYGRPGGAALQAHDKVFAIRYVPYIGDGGKGLAAPEIADLQAYGIAIGLVFERGSARVLQGRPAGLVDGRTAKDAASSLGFPDRTPIYFAVDFDASKAQQPLIDAYLDGAAAVLGIARVGVYGSVDVVNRCAANSSARWFWQTYAWSGGIVSPHAHVLQYRNGQSINGAAVDYCRALQTDFGQWLPLPDSSTGDDVNTVITVLPFGGTFRIPISVVAFEFDPATGVIGSRKTLTPTDHPLVNYDATVVTTATRGDPFLRIADGTYEGWLVASASVTETPNAAPDCTTEVATARASQREADRVAVLAAVGKAIP